VRLRGETPTDANDDKDDSEGAETAEVIVDDWKKEGALLLDATLAGAGVCVERLETLRADVKEPDVELSVCCLAVLL